MVIDSPHGGKLGITPTPGEMNFGVSLIRLRRHEPDPIMGIMDEIAFKRRFKSNISTA
jgi:hypothetical protein